MLGWLLTGLWIQENVVNPAAIFVGGEQVVTVKVPRDIHTQAGITPSKLRVMVGYRVAVWVDDEDVLLPVNALLGVVVGDGLLQA